MMSIRITFVAALTAALALPGMHAWAQTAAPTANQGAASAAKKELVKKVLAAQQSGIESIANNLAGQTATQVMQGTAPALSRLPADKREAAAGDIRAEVRKFYEDASAMLRKRAVELGPSTIGTQLEEKFTEDELKTLLTWLESPVNRKFQQLAVEMQQGLGQKLVAETRTAIEPKLKALEQAIGKRLSAAAEAGASAPKSSAPKASAPAKK